MRYGACTLTCRRHRHFCVGDMLAAAIHVCNCQCSIIPAHGKDCHGIEVSCSPPFMTLAAVHAPVAGVVPAQRFPKVSRTDLASGGPETVANRCTSKLRHNRAEVPDTLHGRNPPFMTRRVSQTHAWAIRATPAHTFPALSRAVSAALGSWNVRNVENICSSSRQSSVIATPSSPHTHKWSCNWSIVWSVVGTLVLGAGHDRTRTY